jgi:hypothetical protein
LDDVQTPKKRPFVACCPQVAPKFLTSARFASYSSSSFSLRPARLPPSCPRPSMRQEQSPSSEVPASRSQSSRFSNTHRPFHAWPSTLHNASRVPDPDRGEESPWPCAGHLANVP